MELLNKLKAIEYIYEDISPNIFLYRQSHEKDFLLIDKINSKQKEFTLDSLIIYLQFTDYDLVRLNIILDTILTNQAIYHKMMMEDNLKILNLTISDINIMEDELKETLKEITKKYVSKRLYIVRGEK